MLKSLPSRRGRFFLWNIASFPKRISNKSPSPTKRSAPPRYEAVRLCEQLFLTNYSTLCVVASFRETPTRQLINASRHRAFARKYLFTNYSTSLRPCSLASAQCEAQSSCVKPFHPYQKKPNFNPSQNYSTWNTTCTTNRTCWNLLPKAMKLLSGKSTINTVLPYILSPIPSLKQISSPKKSPRMYSLKCGRTGLS